MVQWIQWVSSSWNIGMDWSPIAIDCRLSYNRPWLWVLPMHRSSSKGVLKWNGMDDQSRKHATNFFPGMDLNLENFDLWPACLLRATLRLYNILVVWHVVYSKFDICLNHMTCGPLVPEIWKPIDGLLVTLITYCTSQPYLWHKTFSCLLM